MSPRGRDDRWTLVPATLAGAVCLALGLGCSKDDPTGVTAPETASVTLNLDHSVQGRELVLGALLYTNTAGNPFGVDDLRYYLSDVQFHAADGSTFLVDAYHLRDAADASTRSWTVDGVPVGTYTSISFILGLDAERNVWGALDDTPANTDMRWPVSLGDGYHYMKMIGPFLDEGGARQHFEINRGRIMVGGDAHALYSRVLLPSSSVSVEREGANTVEVTMDVARWFQNPLYDFNEQPADMTGDADAQRILRENAPSVYMQEEIPADTLIFAPPGFPPMVVPPDNPTTTDGILLGRMLYYDPILSGDSTLACAGCHMPERSFSDDRRFSVGIDDIEGDRNAPAVINVGWMRDLFWDGRAVGVEAQARQPVTNPIEMHLEWDEAVSRLEAHPTYPALFAQAFGTPEISEDRVVMAIAQFERSMVSADSKYDRWFRGDDVFTESELNGFTLFFTEVGDCFHCHVGDNGLFTDNLFHNVGLESEIVDVGRFAVTGRESDRGLFKTPTLRNLDFTAPYMHDGRFQTLEQVVQHYNSGGHGSPTVDPLIRVGVGLGLTEAQKADLIAFLRTLNDPGYITTPAYQNPFE